MNEDLISKNLIMLQMIAEKEMLSFKEALLYLDVSESFLYKLTSNKGIEFSKPNRGKVYFKKKDLDKWMLQNPSTTVRVLEENILNNMQNAKKL